MIWFFLLCECMYVGICCCVIVCVFEFVVVLMCVCWSLLLRECMCLGVYWFVSVGWNLLVCEC